MSGDPGEQAADGDRQRLGPPPAAADLTARRALLDRQVVSADGTLVCKVDDLELAPTPDGGWEVSAILAGPEALGPRLGGVIGGALVTLARWWRLRSLDDGPRPHRIGWHLVAHVDSAVHLRVTDDQAWLQPLEHLLREHVIDRLPGGSHAPE